METKTWISIKDRKDLIHDVNKIEVLLLERERIANGEIKTNTFIKTYLTA